MPEKLQQNWNSIPLYSGSIIIGTASTAYVGYYIKMKTYDGYECGSIFFTSGTSSRSFLWRYHTANGGTYSFSEVTYDADLETINTNINNITTLKKIQYTTVDGAFVSYQAGTVSININGLGYPDMAGSWILTTSIPKNTFVQIATASNVNNLNDKEIIIPCILSQPSGGGYSTGYIVCNVNGLYIMSNNNYTYTAGSTYGITVMFGTAT